MRLMLVSNLVQFVNAVLATLIMRWILEISTLERDLLWLKRQRWYNEYRRLKFYRGMEYFRQLEFQRIMKGF